MQALEHIVLLVPEKASADAKRGALHTDEMSSRWRLKQRWKIFHYVTPDRFREQAEAYWPRVGAETFMLGLGCLERALQVSGISSRGDDELPPGEQLPA